MSEAPCSAFCFIQHFHFLPYRLLMSGDHHLGDTFPVLDHKRFGGKVDQNNADFSTIVRINRSRRVELQILVEEQYRFLSAPDNAAMAPM